MEIYNDPNSYFIADFFGSPSMNLIAGEIEAADGARRFVNPAFSIPLPDSYAAVPTGTATLGIRPEHVRIGTATPSFTRQIRLVEPMGKETLVYINYGGERDMIAITDSNAEARNRRRSRCRAQSIEDSAFCRRRDPHPRQRPLISRRPLPSPPHRLHRAIRKSAAAPRDSR